LSLSQSGGAQRNATKISLLRRRKMGRTILLPPDKRTELIKLAQTFELLSKLSGPVCLSPRAEQLFENYQLANRKQIDETDPLEESLLSRLGTSPTHVLKVAQIFEACRAIYEGSWDNQIQGNTLACAIEHVAECERAVAALDLISRRIYIATCD
jgi:hypothetical protein